MEFRSVESLIWLFGENWHRQIFINESGDIYSDCKILFCSEEEVKYTITLFYIKFDNSQCKNKKEAEKEAFENHTTVSVESSKQSSTFFYPKTFTLIFCIEKSEIRFQFDVEDSKRKANQQKEYDEENFVNMPHIDGSQPSQEDIDCRRSAQRK
jgi:hypothetical protein